MDSQEKEQEVEQESYLHHLEDLAVILSFPGFVLAMLMWGIAATFPDLAAPFNVATSLVIVSIAVTAGIRLGELVWDWWKDHIIGEQDPFWLIAIIIIVTLLVLGAIESIQTITHAGQITDNRAWLAGGAIIINILQYREIEKRARKTRP